AVRRGFEIGDLRDEFGLNPYHIAPRLGRRGGEGAVRPLQPFEARQQRTESLVAEACADSPAIDQLAGPVELAHQQRPEGAAGLVEQAIAADDELVAADALRLDPHRTAPRGI